MNEQTLKDLEAFNKYELPQPVFKETQKGFKVTVFKTTQKIKTYW